MLIKLFKSLMMMMRCCFTIAIAVSVAAPDVDTVVAPLNCDVDNDCVGDDDGDNDFYVSFAVDIADNVVVVVYSYFG